MAKRFYPAVLERGDNGTVAVWFPDFPDAVAAGRSSPQAIERAEKVLLRAVEKLIEREIDLPAASAIEAVAVPADCDFIAFIMVGVEPPDPSERVNVYLPRSLIARIDARANELGMSRSSFFGLAASTALSMFTGSTDPAMWAWWVEKAEEGGIETPAGRKRGKR
jgi:predicted RNase H-like HicB family nuclease